MTSISDLPADRQAVLSLLVKQRRTYEQVAGMLKIEPDAVRSRAIDAATALGGEATGVSDEERAQIADYLLGQLSESARIETLALLLDTGPGRAWARRVAEELAPIAGDAMPAVPEDPDGPARPAPQAPAPAASATDPAAQAPERDPAAVGPAAEAADGEPRPSAGRAADRGLAVLVLAAALIAAAIVVFIVNSGSSSAPPTGPIPATAATATVASSSTTAGTSTGATGSTAVTQELVLRPTAAGGNAAGAVAILGAGASPKLAFTAQKLPTPPTGAQYVLWLYDSPTHFEALGVVPTPSNGTVSPVEVSLPANASSYHGVVVTTETSNRPARPGGIILKGTSSSPL